MHKRNNNRLFDMLIIALCCYFCYVITGIKCPRAGWCNPALHFPEPPSENKEKKGKEKKKKTYTTFFFSINDIELMFFFQTVD